MTRLQLRFLFVTGALLVGLSPLHALAQVPPPPDASKPKPEPTPEPKPKPTPDATTPTGPPKPAPIDTEPSKEVKAWVASAKKQASVMTKYGDWWSAAEVLEQAYLVFPDPELAFRVAEAAHEGKDCARAQDYYARVLDADFGVSDSMVMATKKGIKELTTFECPARLPEDDVALAETLARRAKTLGAEGDWLGAALDYARAYQLAPSRLPLAYEIGVSTWNAHECSSAVSYFYHFLDVADARKHRSQIKRSTKYISDSETGKCQPWKPKAAAEHARALYAEGHTLELELDYLGAAGKYERAFELLPSNFALSFSVAQSLWTARRCAEAEPHYRTFIAQATDARFDDDRARSETIIGRIDTHGCPAALWNKSIDPSKSKSAADPAAGEESVTPVEEGPPPIAADNQDSVACSVAKNPKGAAAGGLGLLFGLFVLAGLRGNQRRRQD